MSSPAVTWPEKAQAGQVDRLRAASWPHLRAADGVAHMQDTGSGPEHVHLSASRATRVGRDRGVGRSTSRGLVRRRGGGGQRAERAAYV